MPVNSHLEFQEISDFTPGYFSAGEWVMPANGSQEMKDCYPTPGGGVRAAPKPTSHSVSGIPATAKVCGIYAASRQGESAGVGAAAVDRYLAVYDSADLKVKIYRWNESLTSTPTSWTLIKAHAAGGFPNSVQFDTFVDSSLKNHVVWTLAALSADDGCWSLQFSYQAGQGASATDEFGGAPATYSVTQRKAGFCTALAVQDDVLIVAIGARITTLYWSASQDLTSFPAANTLTVQASRQGSVIISITPFAPGDLLCATKFSAWTMIQGGINDPLVRTMSDEKTMGYAQRAVLTPGGLAFIANEAGVYGTASGDSFSPMSDQINPGSWTDSGSNNGSVGGGGVAFGANYIMAPHGMVFDFRTKAWHRQSVLGTSVSDHFHSCYEGQNRQFHVATGGAGFALYDIDLAELTTGRAEDYTWQSAPMRRPQRNIRIREVQLVVKTYNTISTMTLTVGSTSYTKTLTTSGRQTVRWLVDEWDEMLDVTVRMKSNASGTAAPTIEAVRVGSVDDHQTT